VAGCCVKALDIHLEFVHSRLALHVAQHTLLDGGSAGVGAGACAIDVEQRLQGGGGVRQEGWGWGGVGGIRQCGAVGGAQTSFQCRWQIEVIETACVKL
jgi:hypothetical protein